MSFQVRPNLSTRSQRVTCSGCGRWLLHDAQDEARKELPNGTQVGGGVNLEGTWPLD